MSMKGIGKYKRCCQSFGRSSLKFLLPSGPTRSTKDKSPLKKMIKEMKEIGNKA